MTTPASRSLQARIAAHESWARTADRAARTAPARAGLDARFQREARERLGPDATERRRRGIGPASALLPAGRRRGSGEKAAPVTPAGAPPKSRPRPSPGTRTRPQ